MPAASSGGAKTAASALRSAAARTEGLPSIVVATCWNASDRERANAETASVSSPADSNASRGSSVHEERRDAIESAADALGFPFLSVDCAPGNSNDEGGEGGKEWVAPRGIQRLLGMLEDALL